MNNISKKISIIFLMVFTVLSTALAYNVNAALSVPIQNDTSIPYNPEENISGEYNNPYSELDFSPSMSDMRGRLVIESYSQHSYDGGNYITLRELRDYYDVLCRQKGTKLPSENETVLVGSAGDVIVTSISQNLTKDDEGKTIIPNMTACTSYNPYSKSYENLTLGYYNGGAVHTATPKEAYILAEMVNERGGAIFHYDISLDENGNRKKYTGSLDNAEKFTIGNTEILIINKEYVVELPNGDLVMAQQVKQNGTTVYKFKAGHYNGQYQKYEGTLTYQNGDTQESYPSFECSNNPSGANFVPNGSKMYVTGSEIAVKEKGDTTYYQAAVEGTDSYVQLAWWTTVAGSLGNGVPATPFSQEAAAFESYILNVAGVGSTSQLQYTTETIVDAQGNEKTINNAFKIDYKPEWITSNEFENPTVKYEPETDTFVVGPFAIDYVESKVQFGNRKEVEFAGITGMDVYTDASNEQPLVFGEDWTFVYEEGERTDKTNPVYPKSNEKFSIRIKNSENITKITNIKTYFKYMNAAGSWQELHGKYFKATWKWKTAWGETCYNDYHWNYAKDNWGNYKYDKNGNKIKNYYCRKCYLTLASLEEQPSQALALGINGHQWYKTAELDRKVDKNINSGKIVIEKILMDEYGNYLLPQQMDDPNKQFEFILTVEGAMNSGEEKLYVTPGSTVESKVYYWEGDNKPTYKVVETEEPKYRVESIENAEGTIEPSGVAQAKVTAKNILEEGPKEGYLNLIKIMQPTELDTSKFTFVGKDFEFDVTVNGTFSYIENNEEIKVEDGSKVFKVFVTAAENIESAVAKQVGPIKWRGQNAPTYSIKEIKQEGAELISITPSEGTFVDGKDNATTAVAENKISDDEKASVRIIKTLDGSIGLSEDYVKTLVFKFKLNVEGYDEEIITLDTPTGTDANGNWVWEGTSSEYTWAYGNNPNYTIEEFDVPEGTEFDAGRSTVSGTLVSDKTQNYEVTNNVINNFHKDDTKKGKIILTKLISEEVLLNKEFKFDVIVSGIAFKYTSPSGEVFECSNGEKLKLTTAGAVIIPKDYEVNDNYAELKETLNNSYVGITIPESDKSYIVGGKTADESWFSGEFEWYGENNAPRYTVEENLLSEDIASSIQPAQGTLADTETDAVLVTAYNKDNGGPDTKGGYLHIIKTLENADKYDEDYIKSLIFKFKIEVEGYQEAIISIEPKLVNNSWIWEYTSERYSWDANKSAPKYTITEIDIPEGIEFVSAENGDVTNEEGKTSISGTLKESTAEEVGEDIKLVTTDVNFTNKLGQDDEPKKGDLVINKKVTHGSLNGKAFKFTVKLKGTFTYNGVDYVNTELEVYSKENPLIVNGGEQKSIGTVSWYGDVAPEYTVQELESSIADQVSLVNASGTIKEGASATVVTATNAPKMVGGYLSITKILQGNAGTEEQEFTFKVSIDGKQPYNVTIRANETYRSDMIKWNLAEYASQEQIEQLEKGQIKLEDIPGPAYAVEENPSEYSKLIEMRNATGNLRAGETAEAAVVAENAIDEKTGQFKVKKVVLDEKLIDAAAEQKFTITAKVEGKFKIEGQDGTYTNGKFDLELKGGDEFVSPKIIWWGNEAPKVTVTETNLPLGWQLEGISNNGATLKEGETIEIVVTNKLPVYIEIDLTTKLAGRVWEDVPQDDGKNMENSVPNGFIDTSEKAIPGVEVNVYKIIKDASGNEVERNLATVYKDRNNTELKLPIVTETDGKWEAPRVKIPTVTEEQKANGYTATYDVEFIYDGQTYEPTKFLATSNGDAASYINAKTAEKDKYANDSMALDYDRDVVNNRIQSVEGNTPIDGLGNTTGKAVGNEGENNLNYTSNAVNNSKDSNLKVISKLQTTDDNGIALDLFKTRARTSMGGLTYPFNRELDEFTGFHLYDQNTTITELGVLQKYWYEAVYNYCLNINLGLVRRPEADLGLAKRLTHAKVSVKGEEEIIPYDTFTFNTLADINADYYTRQVEASQSTPYTLGLYSTDYYYKAEMYREENRDLYEKLETRFANVGGAKATELQVELTYKISVYNESGSYIERINSINDYFDSSYGAPTSIQLNGSDITTYAVQESSILGSDGVTYSKLVIDNLDVKLASGEVAEFIVKFNVEKETTNGVKDTIIKGQKSNVAELASYSTFNQDGTVAGKVDKDSAPANLNIEDYNVKSWYEDDTDAAPVLYLTTKDTERTVSGIAWEDRPESKTEDKTVGNGIKDDNEALIGGLTTQLVEKVTVEGKEYDFVWPTNESLDCLGGRSMKDLTGFDSTIETASEGENLGTYKFESIPSGKYVVRFLYGNDKTQLEDNVGITNQPATALKAENQNYSGNPNILTANYDNDKEGYTPAVYNGQDYKTTIRAEGKANAVDSEARRLEIIANSETITNANANILSTANDKSADHTELYKQYYMFADTTIMNIDGETTAVENMDCGLIERPETAVVLDKQIKSIKLTTNDGVERFNAEYDISYEKSKDITGKVVISKVNEDEYLVANVTLNEANSKAIDHLQAMNKWENKLSSNDEKNEGQQNFRFANIDDDLLHSLTVEINYLITALNVGEQDYTSEALATITETSMANKTDEKYEILKLAKTAYENNAQEGDQEPVGYLGTYYYTGTKADTDQIVTTRVRQIIDYVDNDATFSVLNNATKDHAWRNTNYTELAGNGSNDNRIVDREVLPAYDIQDKNGVSYITKNKNNIILSIDNKDLNADDNNSGFEARLVPYEENADPTTYKSNIGLTITAVTSSQDDTSNELTYDNIAEIVKLQNTVGRRDVLSTPGNANPKFGEFKVSLEERDSSATELVTLIPPQGIQSEVTMTIQILIITAIALVILVAGTIIIKKKVL